MIEETIGKQLKELRLKQGISVATLAEISGVHQSTISGIEGGKYKPRSDTAAKLNSALNGQSLVMDNNLSAETKMLIELAKLLVMERWKSDRFGAELAKCR